MGKIYQKTKDAVLEQTVDVTAAVAFLKDHARSSFDETIELHVHLGLDVEKSDQLVHGSVILPSGAPKSQRVAVLTSDSAQRKAARTAGATLVGGEELIDEIAEKGSLDVDVVVASPGMMAKIAKVARILGPRGLMPNPKTGTVSLEPAATVKELMSGKLSFKMDQLGNIHEAVGKASWDREKIVANVRALIEALQQARPAGVRGKFITSATLASTMSPGVRIAV